MPGLAKVLRAVRRAAKHSTPDAKVIFKEAELADPALVKKLGEDVEPGEQSLDEIFDAMRQTDEIVKPSVLDRLKRRVPNRVKKPKRNAKQLQEWLDDVRDEVEAYDYTPEQFKKLREIRVMLARVKKSKQLTDPDSGDTIRIAAEDQDLLQDLIDTVENELKNQPTRPAG